MWFCVTAPIAVVATLGICMQVSGGVYDKDLHNEMFYSMIIVGLYMRVILTEVGDLHCSLPRAFITAGFLIHLGRREGLPERGTLAIILRDRSIFDASWPTRWLSCRGSDGAVSTEEGAIKIKWSMQTTTSEECELWTALGIGDVGDELEKFKD